MTPHMTGQGLCRLVAQRPKLEGTGQKGGEWYGCSSEKEERGVVFLRAECCEGVTEKPDTAWDVCEETGALGRISDFFGDKNKGEHSVGIGDIGIEISK